MLMMIHDVLLAMAFFIQAGFQAMWDTIVSIATNLAFAAWSLGWAAPLIGGKLLGQLLANRLFR